MYDHRQRGDDAGEEQAGRRPAPGKRTLSEQRPATHGDAAPVQAQVQRRAEAAAPSAAPADDPFWFTQIASEGVARASDPLPHLDTVQRAFGHHDVTGVQAQVGGDAAVASQAIGASAYATGTRVAFGAAPDLHTAAHEAAHVVQQRGGVQLAGGVGREGDAYERHADEVADAVVRGDSAAGLLDAGPSGGGAAPGGDAVQRRIGKLSGKSPKSEVESFLDRVVGDDPDARDFLRTMIGDDQDRDEEEALDIWRSTLPGDDLSDGGELSESFDDGESLSDAISGILGKLLSSGNYVFSNPPLNSSGDIYHTVGFLAILAEARLPLPTVVIGYHPPANNSSKTYKQAARAVEFATALGFGDHVRTMQVPVGKSGQLNTKAMNTRKMIVASADASRVARPTILDQKTSTALISLLMQKLGRGLITDLIRHQMTTYGSDVPEETQDASNQWIAVQLDKIRTACPDGNRLVLFNERLAPNQSQHNSEGPEFAAIRKHIAGMEDVSHYTLRSHDGDAPEGEEAVSSPSFADAGVGGDERPRGFNSKVQHLQLLRAILEEFGDRLIGIYGSTSGTLDAAALIGMRTLSLHNFSIDIKSKKGGLNEQDQRELLMAPFKSVVRRDGQNPDEAVDAFEAWADDMYAGPEFTTKEMGKIKPIYSRATVAKGDPKKKSYSEEEVEFGLPGGFDGLLDALEPQRGGIEEALGALQCVDHQARDLTRGASTGVGMNCLIHTLVQLADGSGPPGPIVDTIRQAMVDSGAAVVDGMLDPYEDGAGAALMQQFRQARGFRTQILQWTGGHLLVHPVVGGGGPVRLLLHAGNHFEPIGGNEGIAVQATHGVGGADALGGDFEDEDLQRAIAESLASKKQAPSKLESSLLSSSTPVLWRDPLDDFSPVKMHDDRRGSLFVPADQAPSGVKVDDVVLIGGRRAQVTAIEPRLIEVTYRFTWL